MRVNRDSAVAEIIVVLTNATHNKAVTDFFMSFPSKFKIINGLIFCCIGLTFFLYGMFIVTQCLICVNASGANDAFLDLNCRILALCKPNGSRNCHSQVQTTAGKFLRWLDIADMV